MSRATREGFWHQGDGQILQAGLLLGGRILILEGVLFLLIAFKHAEVDVVADHHGQAQTEGHAGVLILGTQNAGEHTGQRHAYQGEDHLGEAVPHSPGGGQLGPLLLSLTGHTDHGDAGYIGELPQGMADDGRRHDNEAGDYAVTDLDKLEGVNQRDQPGDHHQPGPVASPPHGFAAVDDAAGHAHQDGADYAGHGGDDGDGCHGILGHVGEEKAEEIRFHIGGQGVAAVPTP